MSLWQSFFEHNEIIILFIDGQVFFVMGLAIALQSRHHSRLALARHLGWLAAFGIVHAAYEWGHIILQTQEGVLSPGLVTTFHFVHATLLTLSFAFLFQFGAALISEKYEYLLPLPFVLFTLWGAWFISPHLSIIRVIIDWSESAAASARYFIGFPAALLVAYGLRFQASRHIKQLSLLPTYRMLRIAGGAFFAYSILDGLIPAAAPFFPANILNEEMVMATIGIPMPVFRAITATVFAIAIIRALEVFNLEVDELIEQMEMEQNLVTEREKIGRELHDGAMQQIYSAGMLIESAKNKLHKDLPLASERLDLANETLTDAVTSLRTYMTNLRSNPQTIALIDGLKQAAENPRFTSFATIKLQIDLPGPTVLTSWQTMHILTILNEAMSNVIRHAQAQQIAIHAALKQGEFVLAVTDNGVGFNPSKNGGGYGLRNMTDRARLLNGNLVITPVSSGGTTLILTIPHEEIV